MSSPRSATPRPPLPPGLRTTTERSSGRVLAGTSGFAYPGWAPAFYPAGVPASRLLAQYATRLRAVELNNTFYARPSSQRIAAWVGATPAPFRFVVKAQRGAAWRAMRGGATDSVPWLTEALPGFGERLGAVLFRVPGEMPRDDAALDALLAAWPAALPLVVELQHESWHVDETFARLRDAGAVLCATDVDGADEPAVRRTGPFVYVRLRREGYDDARVDAWAARVAPFVDDGLDAWVILRHDEHGRNALLAESFAGRVDVARGR